MLKHVTISLEALGEEPRDSDVQAVASAWIQAAAHGVIASRGAFAMRPRPTAIVLVGLAATMDLLGTDHQDCYRKLMWRSASECGFRSADISFSDCIGTDDLNYCDHWQSYSLLLEVEPIFGLPALQTDSKRIVCPDSLPLSVAAKARLWEWVQSYEAVYRLWLAGSMDEGATSQLLDHQAMLNRRGRELAGELSIELGVGVAYRTMKLHQADGLSG